MTETAVSGEHPIDPDAVSRLPGGYDAHVDLQRLEQIELVAADGTAHRLGDYWATQPVILVFLRHFG